MAISVPIQISIESIYGNRTAESEGFRFWLSCVLSFCIHWGAPWLYGWCRNGLEASRLSEWIRPLILDTEMQPWGVMKCMSYSRDQIKRIWQRVWVCCCIVTKSCLTLTTPPAARQGSLSVTSSQSSPKLMSIQSVMPSNHLIHCRPLLLPSIIPSIRVFSSESVLHIRGSKYWSFGFSIIPSKEYSVLLSFRIDWFGCLIAQGAFKSVLQHHISKASAFLALRLLINKSG